MAERVLVAMSGGVDSAVAAALLVQAGYDVVGVSMRLWSGGDEDASGCCSLDDFLDARRVAHRLGIPFYVWDFQSDFEREVVVPFVADYGAGRTPNPCVRCNQAVKFGSLWERAREIGAAALATGHYARVCRGTEGAWELWRGADVEKDQSYFLFAIPGAILGRTCFPVGHMRKAQVRALAAELELPVAEKADSQEVCFAPGRVHTEFVAARLGEERPRPGAIVDGDGAVVGMHGGVHGVTVGQRRGLRINAGGRRYVTGVDAQSATVRVGPVEALASSGVRAERVNWLVSTIPERGRQCSVKIRSRHGAVAVEVEEAGPDRFAVRAAGGLRAVTPGQAAVLYDGDRVLGGGWIVGAL